jgi:hypothetical protein
MASRTLARTLSNVLNPFVIFTALYVFVAFSEADASRALLYVALELLAALAVAGYVLFMRHHSRVGDFWISARAERLTPALFLLTAFLALLGALALLDVPLQGQCPLHRRRARRHRGSLGARPLGDHLYRCATARGLGADRARRTHGPGNVRGRGSGDDLRAPVPGMKEAHHKAGYEE